MGRAMISLRSGSTARKGRCGKRVAEGAIGKALQDVVGAWQGTVIGVTNFIANQRMLNTNWEESRHATWFRGTRNT